ncbi:hypothetical protein ABIF07_005458 [Bradyrhizobium elkanii]|uniref:hypothetical protein n=1 Tax=Bradyrhizobium elkanii TaxID=29448 RepID=UPI002168413B|nr:hypothetical protein [Bradyrhizobium elkanii]MCS3687515.1 hypothetical protein [Bradyrhizobium elkanii]
MRHATDRIWSTIANNHQPNISSHIDHPIRQAGYPPDQSTDETNSTRDKPDYPSLPKPDWLRGYAQLVTDRVSEGWSCYMVTILFSQLPGSRQAILHRMRDEVARVYSTLVTDVHRKPKNARPGQLPVLIGAFDLPVYKVDRSNAPPVRCNGGLHLHTLVLIPPSARLKGSLVDYFQDKQDLYVRLDKPIQRIHVQPIVDGHDRVVDYMFKNVLRRRLSYDDALVVLPRSRTEL